MLLSTIVNHRLTMRENRISYFKIDKADQCYIKTTNRCKNNASEDAFVFIHDIGNKAFKTWNNTTE